MPAFSKHLLLPIQIENSAEEFALYVVHTSGGKSEEHSVLEDFYLTQNSKLKTKTPSASCACCLPFGNSQMLFASTAGGVPDVARKQTLKPNCLLKKELDFLEGQIQPISPL